MAKEIKFGEEAKKLLTGVDKLAGTVKLLLAQKVETFYLRRNTAAR